MILAASMPEQLTSHLHPVCFQQQTFLTTTYTPATPSTGLESWFAFAPNAAPATLGSIPPPNAGFRMLICPLSLATPKSFAT